MLIHVPTLVLGAFAVLPIFLGLCVGALGSVSIRKKGFLNAVGVGILAFLVVDVFSHLAETVGAAHNVSILSIAQGESR